MSEQKEQETTYGQGELSSTAAVEAPAVAYRPRNPRSYAPNIGLIGCGGITQQHLAAYKAAGYNVVALCDVSLQKAEARRDEFFPAAQVTTNAAEVLGRADIEVVDIATHPAQRVALIEAALEAGKHVLSQKPFVLDLDTGDRLVRLAAEKGLKLAVNQNGRWAPHFSYMRNAVAGGLIGEVKAIDFTVQWNHNWIKETPFNAIHHIILYDFGIHWFDITLALLNGKEPRSVSATVANSPGQLATPPMLAQVLVDCGDAQVSLILNGDTTYGSVDRTDVIGSEGTFRSSGADLASQTVELFTAAGRAVPTLEGSWFPDGFWGSMAELLCAIEEDREPANSARQNLKSLEFCFAACASADAGVPQKPGDVRQVPASCIAKN